MNDQLARTLERIRAGKVSRCTQTELLELCDEAEAARVMRGGVPSRQMTDSQINEAIMAERDDLAQRLADMTRAHAIASARAAPHPRLADLDRDLADARAQILVLEQRIEQALGAPWAKWQQLVDQRNDLEDRLSQIRAIAEGRP